MRGEEVDEPEPVEIPDEVKYPLLSVPDDQLSADTLKEKRRQKAAKGLDEHRKRVLLSSLSLLLFSLFSSRLFTFTNRVLLSSDMPFSILSPCEAPRSRAQSVPSLPRPASRVPHCPLCASSAGGRSASRRRRRCRRR